MGAADTPRTGMADDAVDLAGRWDVIHHVTQSRVARYVGLEIRFQVALRQDGTRITGSGEKYRVGHELIPSTERSLLAIAGSIEGGRVTLEIVERSPAHPDRDIGASVDWQVAGPNLVAGTFRSEAGESTGRSRAMRQRAEDEPAV